MLEIEIVITVGMQFRVGFGDPEMQFTGSASLLYPPQDWAATVLRVG